MSSDISIIVAHPDGYRTNIEVGNYTHNIGPMLEAACGVTLSWFDGVSCEMARPILAHAFHELKSNPDKYRTFDPPNHWGSYRTFLPYITRFYVLTRLHPTGQIRNFY